MGSGACGASIVRHVESEAEDLGVVSWFFVWLVKGRGGERWDERGCPFFETCLRL